MSQWDRLKSERNGQIGGGHCLIVVPTVTFSAFFSLLFSFSFFIIELARFFLFNSTFICINTDWTIVFGIICKEIQLSDIIFD